MRTNCTQHNANHIHSFQYIKHRCLGKRSNLIQVATKLKYIFSLVRDHLVDRNILTIRKWQEKRCLKPYHTVAFQLFLSFGEEQIRVHQHKIYGISFLFWYCIFVQNLEQFQKTFPCFEQTKCIAFQTQNKKAN